MREEEGKEVLVIEGKIENRCGNDDRYEESEGLVKAKKPRKQEYESVRDHMRERGRSLGVRR